MRFDEFKQLNEDAGFSLVVPKDRSCPEVADLQKVLKAFGHSLGPPDVDGVLGRYTTAALKGAQAEIGLPETGVPDEKTIELLNLALREVPEIVSKLTKSTIADVRSASGADNIDVSTIQDPDFNKKLDNIANQLGVNSSDLLAIMKQESGVNPHARNKQGGATGLIQFMPNTARRLGTTTDDLIKMTAVQQLDYVYKYFKMVGIRPGMKLGDLYMAVFMPKYVGHDDTTVLGASGASGFSGKVYAQNKVLDRNKDGTITIADVKNSVARFA